MKLVTDLKVVFGKNPSVPAGFERIPVDLNRGAGGEYIWLCFKREELNFNDLASGVSMRTGIVDIIVLHGDSENVACPPGYIKIDKDLNKGAKGAFIYFAYKAGTPEQCKLLGITDVIIIDEGIINNTLIHKYKEFIIKDYDLNKGAKGAYLYLAYRNVSGASLSNWQSLLPDDTRLVDVSIPGTHDTMTYDMEPKSLDQAAREQAGKAAGIGTSALLDLFGALRLTDSKLGKNGAEPLAKTQNLDLRGQLESGARCVDIRVDSKLGCHHGVFICKNDFQTALYTTYDFLNENPSEFVVFRLGDEMIDESVVDKFKTFLKSVSIKLFTLKPDKKGETKKISDIKIGDLRGRIIFVYGGEFEDYVKNYGFKFSKDEKCTYMQVQDDYNGPSLKRKYKLITELITGRDRNKLTLNHVSAAAKSDTKSYIVAATTEIATPAWYAERLNPMVENYLLNENFKQPDLGIVIYDFIGTDLSWAVIKHNFGV